VLVVKIELWKRGNPQDKEEIGRMYIANVGGTKERGNYDVSVCKRGNYDVPKHLNPDGPEPVRIGYVGNYPRLTYNVWRLVVRALKSCFPEER
jgi:hypothetical protein